MLDLALAVVKYRLVEPSVISSELSLVAICVAIYALILCCDAVFVALSLAKLSSSSMLFVILASALAFVKYKLVPSVTSAVSMPDSVPFTVRLFAVMLGAVPAPAPMLAVSYTHLRAHETDSYLVCRLLL